MKRNGFTLIELLATIVVIAVVSLITVPVVVSVIEKSRKASFIRSAENIKKISKKYYVDNSLEYQDIDSIYFDCNNSECISNSSNIKKKNLGATGSMGDGYVKIYDKGEIEFLLTNGKYCAEKNPNKEEVKIYNGNCEGIIIDNEKIRINSIKTTSTTSTIKVFGDVITGKSGVSKYEFYIDNKLDATVKTNDTNYTHTFEKVSGKNHKIKVRVYNGTYNSPNWDESTGMDEKEIDASLADFGAITIVSSSTDWKTSKTYAISGTTSGATLQYKVVSGTTVKQDWTNYSSAITIDWTATTKTPTYIYARFNDGVNTSDETTYTETKIDTTSPTLTLGALVVTTKSIVVPITKNEDLESGIKSTKCEYGTSTSYGSIGTIGGNSCVINNVKNNTTYYYKVTTMNNVGLSTVKTGSNVTGQFGAITITSSSTDWKTSKTYTISGTTTGATLQYKIVSGTTVKQDWTNYSSAITVNWTSTTTTPTYIYARLNDGVNTSDETTYTETKIDTVAPTVSYSVIGGIYNSYQTVRVLPNDINYSSMAVHVYKNSALVYSEKVDQKSTNGTSASYFDVALDSDGTWTIYTVVYDKAGNKQDQSPDNGTGWYYQTYIIDTIKPTISYNYNAISDQGGYGGAYYMGCFNGGITPTLTLTDTGGSGLSSNNQVNIWKDGTWINNAVSIGNNQWNIPMTTEGRYIPHIIARDNAGNVSQGTRTDGNHLTVWDIDTSAPTMSVNFNGYTPGTWTNGNVAISLSGSNSGCDTGKYYWYSINDGDWVHFGTGDVATYNITNDANYNIKFLITDGFGRWGTQTQNYSIKRDTTAPTFTSAEIKNVTSTGYDIYIYGVSDSGSGVNRVQFPTWTENNGQDDLKAGWENSTFAAGINQGNGTWYYRVNVTDHNNESGTYITHIYLWDNVGNVSALNTSTVDNVVNVPTAVPVATLQVLNGLNIDNGWVGNTNNINLQFGCTSGVTSYAYKVYDLGVIDSYGNYGLVASSTINTTSTLYTDLFTNNLSNLTYNYETIDGYGHKNNNITYVKGDLKVELTCTNGSGVTSQKVSKKVMVDGVPTLNLRNIDKSTTSITVKSEASSLSGILKYEFKIDSGSWVNNGTSNVYTFRGLAEYSTHTIYTRVTNNTGVGAKANISAVTSKSSSSGGSSSGGSSDGSSSGGSSGSRPGCGGTVSSNYPRCASSCEASRDVCVANADNTYSNCVNGCKGKTECEAGCSAGKSATVAGCSEGLSNCYKGCC